MEVIAAMNEEQKRSKDTLVDGMGSTDKGGDEGRNGPWSG